MAQRISRAKRSLRDRRLDEPGDLAVVLRVLYLVYTTGHGGRLDLAARRSGSPASSPWPPTSRRRGGCWR
jgi:predicted RNA polymerase sigma factor